LLGLDQLSLESGRLGRSSSIVLNIRKRFVKAQFVPKTKTYKAHQMSTIEKFNSSPRGYNYVENEVSTDLEVSVSVSGHFIYAKCGYVKNLL
jgi:hypothetical protein